MSNISMRFAVAEDVPLILSFIKSIAEFEKLSHLVEADEATLLQSLFGDSPAAEVLLAFVDDQPAAFAVFFHSFSTFTGKRGLWLDDLFVKPEFRGMNVGKNLLKKLGAIAVERNCARFEWIVLDWNKNAIEFYEKTGAEILRQWHICRFSGERLNNFADKLK